MVPGTRGGQAAATAVAGEGLNPGKATKTLRLLYEQLRPIGLRMGGGLLLMVLGTLSGLVQPLATGRILDSLSANVDLTDSIILLIAALLGAIVFSYSGSYLLLSSTESMVGRIRDRIVRRSLSLTLAEMDRQNPGELLTRVTSDASTIRLLAVTFLTQLVTGVISIVGALAAMATINVFLLAVTLCLAFLPGSLLLLTVPKVRTWSRHTQIALGALGKELERVLGNFTMVKASSAEAQEAEVLRGRIDTTERMGKRAGAWRSVSSALSQTTMQVSYIVVLATGGVLVDQGRMSVASLVTFLMYASQLSAPIVGLTMAANAFQSGYASLERAAEVENMAREANSGSLVVEGAKTQPAVAGASALGVTSPTTPVSERFAVDFNDVVFSYPGQSEPALRSLRLRLPDRGLTALVGRSGCGKSTILRLACAFYPIDGGELCIAERPIEQWDLRELRSRIAYVAQEAPVVEGSIRDNLLYGRNDGTVNDEDLHTALATVALDDAFPDLETPVGYRGQSLSGGERQRLSIARGLLRSPRILLLDESTSALDTTTEQRVIRQLRKIGDSVGVVMVAHRLATVIDADEIVVLDGGRVRASGTHAELLDRDDLYRQLVSDGKRGEGPMGDGDSG